LLETPKDAVRLDRAWTQSVAHQLGTRLHDGEQVSQVMVLQPLKTFVQDAGNQMFSSSLPDAPIVFERLFKVRFPESVVSSARTDDGVV
jgi:hypothetical protein